MIMISIIIISNILSTCINPERFALDSMDQSYQPPFHSLSSWEVGKLNKFPRLLQLGSRV